MCPTNSVTNKSILAEIFHLVFLFFLYSNDQVHVTGDNDVRTARVRRTNPVIMDARDDKLSANDLKNLQDLTDEIHKIEDFLKYEFNGFEYILDSKPKITAPDKKWSMK